MLDPRQLLDHWGYPAIFGIVVLGNLGLPLPEEGVLILAGYLVWTGKLRLDAVIVLAIASAVLGDNLGYWFGRRYGRAAILLYGRRLFITEARLEKTSRFVKRFGPYAVFFARFLPGVRFMAGPLAGSAGMDFTLFFAANIAGGTIYAPACVGVGYLLGQGLGDILMRFEIIVGKVEHYALALIGLIAVVIGVWRWLNSRKSPNGNCVG